MADSPAIAAKRVALARKIGAQMSAASKTRRSREANAQYLEDNGAFASANRGRAQAAGGFKRAKKSIMAELGKTFG